MVLFSLIISSQDKTEIERENKQERQEMWKIKKKKEGEKIVHWSWLHQNYYYPYFSL